MKKTIDFGKVAYTNIDRKANRVTVEVRLDERETDYGYPYSCLSIGGRIWNTRETDIVCGGQCLDEIAKYISNDKFNKIYDWWKKYHLNDLRAGTPSQQKLVKEYLTDHRYDYTEVCDYLKEHNMYIDYSPCRTITKEYAEGEGYRYGSGWVIEEIPEETIKEIKEFLSNES